MKQSSSKSGVYSDPDMHASRYKKILNEKKNNFTPQQLEK